MSKINKARKAFVEDRFEKMASGNLVDDAEIQGMAQQQQVQADQVLSAQQRQANQSAMTNAASGVQQMGQQKQQAQALGQASANAAVAAKGEAQSLASAIREKRAAEALAAAERLIADKRAQTQATIDQIGQVVETGANIAKV